MSGGRLSGVALAFAILARTVDAQSPQKPIEFRSQVGAVHVDAFVTRGGQPVPGLRASDFELRDNGVPQALELLLAESRPLLAVLVFDTSSSMAGDRLEALRAAGEAFLDGLRPSDQVGLVAFSEDVYWLADPSSDKAVVRRALGRLRASGATSLYDALYAGITLSEGQLRPLVVLFSDGEDNTSWLGEADLKLVAERSNALVHVVGWRPRCRSRRSASCRWRRSRRRTVRCARSRRPRAGASGTPTRPPGCGTPSARSPTRWAIATCCATSPRESSVPAGTGSRRGCAAASRATSTCAAATGSRLEPRATQAPRRGSPRPA